MKLRLVRSGGRPLAAIVVGWQSTVTLDAGLRKNLQERFDLDVVEHAARDVRVARDDLPHGFARFGLDHDQAAGAVGEGAREQDAAFIGERREVCQMCGADGRAFFFSVRGVVADDHKQH